MRSMFTKKHIAFLPYKLHLRHLLFEIAETLPVTVFLPPEKSLPADSSLAGVRIVYSEFGAQYIKRLVGRELRTLKYVGGLHKLLDSVGMDVLVSFEFYHWYTLQSIKYKKEHSEMKLFVVSETKRWPTNVVARFFKKLLLQHFRKNMKHIDGVFVYTDTAKEFLARHAPEANVTLLPAPTNTDVFVPQEGKTYMPDGDLRILMNARYSPYKRHDDLFTAIRSLRDSGKRVHVTCISRDNKNKEETVSLAREKGVLEHVTFIDALPQSEMPGLYYAHDVLVLPSYNEAIGMVVPEAMACGIPTLTSDTVGANVYVAHEETGFIFETGNVQELTNALEKLCNSDVLQAMGAAAHERIQKKFTPHAVAEHFITTLEEGSRSAL